MKLGLVCDRWPRGRNQRLIQPAAEVNRAAGFKLLAHDPIGGCFLGVPGLKQLLGNAAQGVRIGGGINRSAETLDLKLLPNGERDWHGHDNDSVKLKRRYRAHPGKA